MARLKMREDPEEGPPLPSARAAFEPPPLLPGPEAAPGVKDRRAFRVGLSHAINSSAQDLCRGKVCWVKKIITANAANNPGLARARVEEKP